MVNVKDKTCKEPGCKTLPCYNYEGEKKGLYCATHKKEGMVDITHKTCKVHGCNTRPNYNYEGEKKGMYCTTHKKDGMVDITHKTCKSEWCNTRPNYKYEGYCLYCYMNLFPDKPIVRNYKTKEHSVVEFVKSRFPNEDWIADKIVSGGCSRRRPDLLLDMGDKCVIIEVDENQHLDYDCSCENKRIMEISRDLAHRPIIFIRFNPDAYFKATKKISSCWCVNGNGICCVKKSKKKEWDTRLIQLEETIKYWINPKNSPNKIVETIQLYYDQ